MSNWKKQRRIDLNPSSADRWTTCTASPKFIYDNWDKLPQEDRKYADEGNSAHEVAAAYLQDRQPQASECPVPVTEEMRWHGFGYWDFVTSLREPRSQLLVEQKLPLFYNESRNAIVDAAVINPDNLHIVDYKYGEGIIVSPENNLQAIIYAKSVVQNILHSGSGFNCYSLRRMLLSGDVPITIHIYQPRSRGDTPFHSWKTSWDEIRLEAGKIFETARHILLVSDLVKPAPDNDLVFAPSEKACQWCPAKGFCQARQDAFTVDLPLVMVNDSRVLSDKQLALIALHGDEMKKAITDAQAYALQYARGGKSLPGVKLVMGREGNRRWSDPDKVANYLLEDTILRKEEIYTEPKLLGPASVEKLIGKRKFPKRVYGLISKSPAQSELAAESDPRPSCITDVTECFVNLDEQQPKPSNLDEF